MFHALFFQMRETKRVSVWPVGLVGGAMVERPLVRALDEEGRINMVSGWLTGWKPDRPFAIDMAGFAVNLALLLRTSGAEFSLNVPIGYQESKFLEKMTTVELLEPKADLCTKVSLLFVST